MSYYFTSESVTEGHPDKICDQISDAILDNALKQDPQAHVACECLATTGLVVVAGEMRTNGYVDIAGVTRETIREIGYDDATYGFDYKACAVMVSIDEQSPDIAQGVDTAIGHEQGAGDQGLMFGFACDETPELMPLPISLAHRLTKRLAQVRRGNGLKYLRPDGKSQVTVEYSDEGVPKRLECVVVSTQHSENVEHAQIRKDVIKHVIEPVCGDLLDDRTKFHINPTGRFVIGGPPGDCGLTGRKIIVDTYGGIGRHGGGCFSGKDPSKVDRSAAYAARWIAKHVVRAGLARRCEVQIAYAIGIAQPVSVHVETFGTGTKDDRAIEQAVQKVFDLRPAAIIADLDLLRPQYRALAAYGHMGREDLGVKWEETPRVDSLLQAVG
ncbi:methionine adenosyltransferase [Candidatus Peregrinibacteria bacterium CG10_big_fil_rev_8_21_14_0_10_55_24]|nr:MAG: methionine adenosyltransferase [Candidatus Peregrinibacteria bacterium CG10_big_fil_rev_8_21_14_0_10_55_24]